MLRSNALFLTGPARACSMQAPLQHISQRLLFIEEKLILYLQFHICFLFISYLFHISLLPGGSSYPVRVSFHPQPFYDAMFFQVAETQVRDQDCENQQNRGAGHQRQVGGAKDHNTALISPCHFHRGRL